MKYKDYIEKFLSEMEAAQRDRRWFASDVTMDWAHLKRQQKAFLEARLNKALWPDKLEVDMCQAAVFIGSCYPDCLPKEERAFYPLRRAFKILWNCIRYGTDTGLIEKKRSIETENGPLPIVNLSDVVDFMHDHTAWRATPKQMKTLAKLQAESDSSSAFLGEKGMRKAAIFSLWDAKPEKWLSCDEVYRLLEYKEMSNKTILRDLHDLVNAHHLRMTASGPGKRQLFTKSGNLPHC